MSHATHLERTLYLDIETVPQHRRWEDLDPAAAQLFTDKTRFEQERQQKTAAELYPERAGILAEFGKIVCIGLGTVHLQDGRPALRVTSYHGHDERELLLRLCALMDEHYGGNGHKLCGHNGKEFDFPWIARRCVIHGIPLPRLLDIGGLKPWEVGHIDTMNLWSFGDRKAYTSLALLCHVLGIPTPKDDISGADVARAYYEEDGLERVAAYCRKDVVATVQVHLRLSGLPPIPEGSITTV
ncbi:MAG: 3'-5' exonuclease [Flavobacteriales bacterium]|jgi:predicted PolB exonuclease-like 3'-5' exonuclease|nr:3'-5' exonuclease [Flavobacteriales bacterium]